MTDNTKQLTKCPECKSKDLNYGDTDNSKEGLVQEVECNNCGTEWEEYFKFVRWESS